MSGHRSRVRSAHRSGARRTDTASAKRRARARPDAGRQLSAGTSAVPLIRSGRRRRVERRWLAEWRMTQGELSQALARRLRDVAGQPRGRGRERRRERGLTVTLVGTSPHDEQLPRDGPRGLPGRPAREVPLGGVRAQRWRCVARDRRGCDGARSTLRRRLRCHPRQHSHDREDHGRRAAQQAHREDALQQFRSRSCSEFNAHDSSYPADRRKVPAAGDL